MARSPHRHPTPAALRRSPRGPGPRGAHRGLRLQGWRDPGVVAVALLAFASGFGQFGAVSALGDVARSFGRVVGGTTVADQAGLSGTELGIGLAVLRLASLGGLAVAGLADRFGRRTTLLFSCGLGLAATVAAAASPGYWWFVAVFACGRPLLSATNAVAGVSAAELTAASDRAKAIALVVAGYGLGAGATAVVHGLAADALGFRGTFALAAVPLAALPVIGRRVAEPDRFAVAEAAGEHPLPVLGAVAGPYRRRLVVVASLSFAVAVITGPANSFLYVYAENVRGLSGPAIAAMVAAAGVTGLGGLLVGSWLADRVGRRPASAVAMVAIALLGVVTYSGSRTALVGGYLGGVLAASALGPPAGALANELFPTAVRASVAGWLTAASVLGAVLGLLAFGAIADIGNRFGLAAAAIFVPTAGAAGLFALLPETRGHEPEDLWPTAP
jgi:MFS family permease